MKKNEKLQLDLSELKKFHDIDKNPVNIEVKLNMNRIQIYQRRLKK